MTSIKEFEKVMYSLNIDEIDETPRRLFLEIIKNTGKESRPGGPHPSHEGGGVPAPWACPPTSWAPWTSSDLNSNSIYSVLGRKKLERKFHRVLRHGAAAKP